MIIKDTHSKAQTFGTLESSKASIKVSPAMYKLLSSNIYKDKIGSIVRELTSNAKDAHVEAGKETTPIKITAPSNFDNSFSIRDYGTGLSHESVMSMYLTFGLSTKNGSNDYIGAMGIGSKSPLSYRDAFNVNSYYNGIKSSYIIFMDDGIPNINRLSKFPTSEANGLEIIIAVEPSDTWLFNEAIKNFLFLFDFPVDTDGVTIDTPNITKHEGYWVVKDKDYGLAINMGGVVYPISDMHIFSEVPLKTENYIVFPFEIGALSVTTSREGLSYDDATKNALEARFKEYNLVVMEDINKGMGDLSKPYEAFAYAYEQLGRKANTFFDRLTFDGKNLEEWRTHYYNFTNQQVRYFRGPSYYHTKKTGEYLQFSRHVLQTMTHYGNTTGEIIVYVNDVKGGVKLAQAIVESKRKSLLYFTKEALEDEPEQKKCYDMALEALECELIIASDVKEQYQPTIIATKKTYQKSSGLFKVNRYGSEQLDKIDNEEEGYYLNMFRNNVYLGCGERPYSVDCISDLKEAGLFGDKEVYLIRKTSNLKKDKLSLVEVTPEVLISLFYKKYNKRAIKRCIRYKAYMNEIPYRIDLGSEQEVFYKELSSDKGLFSTMFNHNATYIYSKYTDKTSADFFNIVQKIKQMGLQLPDYLTASTDYGHKIIRSIDRTSDLLKIKYPLLGAGVDAGIMRCKLYEYIGLCDDAVTVKLASRASVSSVESVESVA